MPEQKERTNQAERERQDREEQADIAREARTLKLDEVEEGTSPVYLVGGQPVGANGRKIRADGTEEPAPAGQ